MVQIKLWGISVAWKWIRLYIPYGSDKTRFIHNFHHPIGGFISHMVQIKRDIDLQKIPASLALYPIWFR